MWYFRFVTHLNPHSVHTVFESNRKEWKRKMVFVIMQRFYDAIIKRMTLMIMIFIGPNFTHKNTEKKKSGKPKYEAKKKKNERGIGTKTIPHWIANRAWKRNGQEFLFLWTESVVYCCFSIEMCSIKMNGYKCFIHTMHLCCAYTILSTLNADHSDNRGHTVDSINLLMHFRWSRVHFTFDWTNSSAQYINFARSLCQLPAIRILLLLLLSMALRLLLLLLL